jgi:hypothetical protein
MPGTYNLQNRPKNVFKQTSTVSNWLFGRAWDCMGMHYAAQS